MDTEATPVAYFLWVGLLPWQQAGNQAVRQAYISGPGTCSAYRPPVPSPRADASVLGLLLTNSAQRWRCRGKERREVASMLQAPSIEENAHFPEGMNKFNYFITFVIGIHWNIFALHKWKPRRSTFRIWFTFFMKISSDCCISNYFVYLYVIPLFLYRISF